MTRPSTARQISVSSVSFIADRISDALATLRSSAGSNSEALPGLGWTNCPTWNGDFLDMSAMAPGTVATCSAS